MANKTSASGGHFQDINDLRVLLAERGRLIAHLQRKNEEAEQFNRLVFHELRNPLHTIRGFSEIMHQDLSKGQTTTLLPDLNRIIDAAARMQSLIDGIHALSKAGRTVELNEQIMIGELVAEILSSLKDGLAAGKIHVVTSDSLPEVNGDRARLRMAVRSLIEQAIKSLERQPEPMIEIDSDSASGEHTIFIRDNGAGISTDRMASLFQPALGTEPGLNELGMGLAIARRIIEAHGGRLWAESEGRGKGACFSFTIPMAGWNASKGHNG
ncbi:MAG: HAMP domain-containing sensor histidine kinase [Opitutaceae bacterium]|jgi:signal transduction histidine kinase